MATVIKHHEGDGYIEIICTGNIDIQQAVSAMEVVVGLSEETGCDLLLANLFDMQHAPDPIEMFNFASNYPSNIRTAMILPHDSDFDHEFFENAARNRGRSISSFTDREHALNWLKNQS